MAQLSIGEYLDDGQEPSTSEGLVGEEEQGGGRAEVLDFDILERETEEIIVDQYWPIPNRQGHQHQLGDIPKGDPEGQVIGEVEDKVALRTGPIAEYQKWITSIEELRSDIPNQSALIKEGRTWGHHLRSWGDGQDLITIGGTIENIDYSIRDDQASEAKIATEKHVKAILEERRIIIKEVVIEELVGLVARTGLVVTQWE